MKVSRLLLISLLIGINFYGHSQDFEDEFSSVASSKLMGVKFSGFVEFEQGYRVTGVGPMQTGLDKQDMVLANRRFRLAIEKDFNDGAISTKIDFLSDEIEFGETVSLREVKFQKRLGEHFDISVGRQVLTWGVGDLLFINDLFPKDWIANFTGQEMEMLKLPSNTLRLNSYFKGYNLDFAYTPQFSPDRVLYGCRFPIYSPQTQSLLFAPQICDQAWAETKEKTFENGEFALSLKKRIERFDLALYAYQGFYKAPKGLRSLPSGQLQAYYPKLRVYGASAEGQLGVGILSFETGYYDSREDRDGSNLLVENSMWKFLLGYRHDLSSHLSYGVQYYLETMANYQSFEQSILSTQPSLYDSKLNRNRQTYTLRLTYKAWQNTFFVTLFTYFRPQDHDSFTKLEVSKKFTDQFKTLVGANIFQGSSRYRDREFGMLDSADNIYLRLRYSF